MSSPVNYKSALNAAKKFFADKSPRIFYKVNVLLCENEVGTCLHHAFSSEDIMALKNLRQKYGEDDFTENLDEIFNEDSISDFAHGGKVIGINLDEPMRKYCFTVRFFDGEEIYNCETMVELSDSEYIELLALRLGDSRMNMNVLRHVNRELHDKIIREIDWYAASNDGIYTCWDPYLVTMDEVNEDVRTIIHRHPRFRQIGGVAYTNLLPVPDSAYFSRKEIDLK